MKNKNYLTKLSKKKCQQDLSNPQLKWNLDLLLENKSIQSWLDEGSKYKKWLIQNHDYIFNNLQTFKKFIIQTRKLNEILSRLYAYADSLSSLKQDDNNSNEIYALLGNWTQDYYDVYYDDVNEILKHEDAIKKYLDADNELQYLKRDYNLIFNSKKHSLSNNEEKLVNELSKDNSSFGSIYDTLVDNDLKFEPVFDKNKKQHFLKTSLDINFALQSLDRVLRKNAYHSLKQGYQSICHTVCQCLYYHYLNAEAWAKAYNFNGYIDSCCYQDEIDSSFVEHVYKMGYLFSDCSKKYAKLTRKLLKFRYGFKKVHGYDTYLSVCQSNYYFSIEQAKQIVFDATKCLGEQYHHFLNEMFNSRYIDWMPRESKTSGEYTQGLGWNINYSFILLNYDYSYSSLTTLIHELGHAGQNYFSKIKNPHQSNMPIFCAEVASITNEILLALYLLKLFKNDNEMCLYIYKHLIYETLSTTIDQIALSKFEWKTIEMINTNQPFTVESVAKTYLDIELEYKLINPKILKEKNYLYKYGLSPLYVSHFYSNNFYVYKYAIGQVCALLIADKLFHEDKTIIKKYFDFLSVGNSLSPMETIKLLDIDLYSNEPWEQASQILKKWLLDYTSLVKNVVLGPKNAKKCSKTPKKT